MLTVHKMIIFTNGCFDPLNSWHLKYLKDASRMGDLIVGVNSDMSMESIKKKPTNSEQDRLNAIRSLSFVKKAILFEEYNPIKLIQRIKPDLYVKGGDYTIETIDQELRRFLDGKIKVKFTKRYPK